MLSFIVLLAQVVFSCIPTSPAPSPTPPVTPRPPDITGPLGTTPPGPTTTISVPAGCCQPLTQTATMTEFPDGLLTFTYNSNVCRTMVVANCSQTDPAFDLFAALFANGFAFLEVGPMSVQFPGTCNATDMRWYMGNPPLRIDTLECLLSNPPPAGR